MIQFSESESALFKVNFGRVELSKDFDDWRDLQSEISSNNYNYVRLKIRDPKGHEIDCIKRLGKAYLLEILRVYTFYNRDDEPRTKLFDGLSFTPVSGNDRNEFEAMLKATYEDIPFGNYTPAQ